MSQNKAHRRLNLTRPTLPTEAAPNAASTRKPLEIEETAPTIISSNADETAAFSSEQKTITAKRASVKNSATKKETATSNAATSDKNSGGVVRVMAYLSEEEADLLDSLWLKLRRHEARPSKSDILRAALTAAARDIDDLTNAMSQQRISTLSRQRSSKMKAPNA